MVVKGLVLTGNNLKSTKLYKGHKTIIILNICINCSSFYLKYQRVVIEHTIESR